MMTQSTSDIDEETWVAMDIGHSLVQLTSASDQLGTSRLVIFANFSFLLRLVTYVREFSRVEAAIMHASYDFADFGLTLDDFVSCLLVAQSEFLEFIGGHDRVFAPKFSSCCQIGI